MEDSEVDCGGEIGSDNVYNDVYNGSAEPVLVSLSNLYSEDDRILSR